MSKLLAKYKDGDKIMIGEVINITPGEGGCSLIRFPSNTSSQNEEDNMDVYIETALLEIYEDKGGEG